MPHICLNLTARALIVHLFLNFCLHCSSFSSVQLRQLWRWQGTSAFLCLLLSLVCYKHATVTPPNSSSNDQLISTCVYKASTSSNSTTQTSRLCSLACSQTHPVTLVQPQGVDYKSQPAMPQQTSVVIVQQPDLRYNLSGMRDFTHGLCDCCEDCHVCMRSRKLL